jgi:hypothetical protein
MFISASSLFAGSAWNNSSKTARNKAFQNTSGR